jgi:redox-sensitive bicupin YhaK (pirin superfamily)
MLQILKSEQRGQADHGWLKSLHTFSFANYHNPKMMGFRSLRVINEDRIQGGTGFGKHPHREMEIISYVVSGALKHEDTMGNKTLIRPGEVQKLSAGSGMMHSEMNANPSEEAHFFQIWIVPQKTGSAPNAPNYGQKSFDSELKSKKLVLVISKDGRDGSLPIQQDAELYLSRLELGQSLEYSLRIGRGLWLQTVSGRVSVNGHLLASGDAVSAEDEEKLQIQAVEKSEFLLFDLA